MGEFHFTTHWRFDTPVRRVWQALLDPLAVASVWENVTVEASRDARPLRKGAAIDLRIRSPLRALLKVTTQVVDLDLHRRIVIEAKGHLDGLGVCRVAPAHDGGSHLEFEWDVDTTHRGLTILAALPGGRRLLTWAHNRVMAAAKRALDKVLEREGSTLNGL